jgi:hypothetical protein
MDRAGGPLPHPGLEVQGVLAAPGEHNAGLPQQVQAAGPFGGVVGVGAVVVVRVGVCGSRWCMQLCEILCKESGSGAEVVRSGKADGPFNGVL